MAMAVIIDKGYKMVFILVISILFMDLSHGNAQLGDADLIAIRDGFEERVEQAFESQRGQTLKRAGIWTYRNKDTEDHVLYGRDGWSPGVNFLRNYSFSVVTYAFRCFILNEQIDSANAALIENAKKYLDEPRDIYDRDHFHWHSDAMFRMIELYGSHGSVRQGLLSEEAESLFMEAAYLYGRHFDNIFISDYETSKTWHIEESENHDNMRKTCLWHFAKLARKMPAFRDRVYGGGRAEEHYRAWTEFLKEYLAERPRRGMFIEMMCDGYNEVLMKGIYNLYDFAEDTELKRRAGLFIDLHWAYWGQEQIDNASGGGKSRIGGDNFNTSLFRNNLAYYFFGMGKPSRISSPMLTALTTAWRPSLVVMDIVLDMPGRGSYEVCQYPRGLVIDGFFTPPQYRMDTDYGGILRYSYCTPEFIMGTAMREARPMDDWAMISSQNSFHGVTFKGHPLARLVPQCNSIFPGAKYNQQWSVQKKGTLISQKLRTSINARDMQVWFSADGLSSPIEVKGWFFVESEGAYAAVHIVQGSTEWKDPETKKENGRYLRCVEEYTPVIVEVALKSDFDSYQDFQSRVTNQALKLKAGILEYTSIYGDEFTFYTDQSRSPEINRKTVRYGPGKALDSPFLQADWNTGVVYIQKGERKLVLDFNSPGYEDARYLPLLKVSEDRHYLVNENNEPFFWLGDTAWELFHRLGRKESLAYLKDRAEKGFNVIQAVVLAELDGLNTPNANGDKPLINNDPTLPNEAYFEHVDFVIQEAGKMGLYMGVLPTWGDKFNDAWGIGPLIFTPENAEKYGAFLGKRYADKNNIVWILGGDRKPADEEDYEIIRAMARGIRKFDSRHLITYHTQGGTSASDFFLHEEWMDIDMFQSGHIRFVKDYEYTRNNRMKEPHRPVVDGEPRYENIPDYLNPRQNDWLDDGDIRQAAYWNMFAGAAGHTYGCNDIWQMYSTGRNPVIYARTSWEVALNLPGAAQVGYMKNLFESFPWQKMQNDQGLILNENPQDSAYVMTVIGDEGDFMLAYSPCGRKIKVKLSALRCKKVAAFWFNPRDANMQPIGIYDTSEMPVFEPTSIGRGSDIVLVLIDVKASYNLPD